MPRIDYISAKLNFFNFSDVPAITAEEWWDGTNAEPVLVSMSEVGGQVKKVNKLISIFVCQIYFVVAC